MLVIVIVVLKMFLLTHGHYKTSCLTVQEVGGVVSHGKVVVERDPSLLH